MKNANVWMAFFGANGFLILAFGTYMAIGPEVLAFALRHWVEIAGIVLFFEVAALLIIRAAILKREEKVDPDKIGEDDLELRSLVFRFARGRDFPETERVYHERLSASLSIDDAEFIRIINKGDYCRLMESVSRKGERVVIGYYSVWPISADTMNGMVAGKIQEKKLRSIDVLSFQDARSRVLYIPDICITPGNKHGFVLFLDLVKYVRSLLLSHPNIDLIAGWPSTKHGKQIIRMYNMRPIMNGRWPTRYFHMSREVALNRSTSAGDFQSDRTIEL